MKDEKKTFMDNAEGFLSAWKNDYADKNKDILERAKKRKEETEALHQELHASWEEVKTDLTGMAKDVYETLLKEFAKFSEAMKEGTATLAEKLQLEERFKQLDFFMKKANDTGAEKVKKITAGLQKKLAAFEPELQKERKNTKQIADNQLDSIDDLNQDASKLFAELDKMNDEF